MPLPAAIQLSNTFGQLVDTTNQIITAVSNTSEYLLVAQNSTPSVSTGNVSLNGTLTVGSVAANSTITVTGAATFSNTLAVTGAATLSNTLAVTGTLNAASILVGNSTVNTAITAGAITLNGGSVITVNSATGINASALSTGTVPNTRLDANVILTTSTTGINASALSTGTVPIARLDANVILTSSTTGINASALSTGTVPDGRVSGAYTSVTSLTLGANVVANVTTIFVGNSTANAVHSATSVALANSTNTATLTPISLTIGTQSANTIGFYAGANVYANVTTVFVGNSSSNTVITGGSITINGTAVGTTTKGSHNLFIPAAAIRPLSTGGAGTIEDATSTNNIAGLPFDPTSSEGAYFWIKMPNSWNEGTITTKFVTFNKAGGSGNFVFSLAGMAASDDDSISIALGTAQQVTDGILTAYDVQISANTSAITLANTPNAGDYCLFVVKRLPSDASDTYASDVYLAGVELTLTTDAENDN